MTARGAWLGALWLLGACTPSSAPEPKAAPAVPEATPAPVATAAPAAPAPAAAAPAAETGKDACPALFGAPIDPAVPEVALAELIAKPEPHAGKPIRTQGSVSRVCQAAGCWMELRDDGSGKTVRTPMAGHAFFLPKTALGKHADVQGIVELRPLTAEHKRHLQGEGATETDALLSISATGVALR